MPVLYSVSGGVGGAGCNWRNRVIGGDTSADSTADSIQDVYNLLSLLTAPDMTTLVTLEVHSPGGNDSVSLVPVRNWKTKTTK